MKNHRFTAYIYLLIVSIIWGAAGPVIKFTLTDFPPLIFLTYRFAISAVVALIAFRGLPRLPKSPEKLWQLLLYSVLTVPVTLTLVFMGFERTSSLEGTLITSIAPLFTIIGAAWFLKEHVTNIEKIGILLALGGTLLIALEPLFLGSAVNTNQHIIGNLLLILSMLTQTIGFLVAKKLLRKDESPDAMSHISFLVGFGVLLPAALFAYPPTTIMNTILSAPLPAHLGVLFMALISGTLAYALNNRGMKTIEVGEASLFSYLGPIWAAPLALLWLHETLTPLFFLACGIIAAGVYLAEQKKHKKKRP